ncbi:NAD-dependent epimerase/dehydratase family protein [Caldivirga maquilingensis]|uniref:NAD-dependent epimerase/dehydratase n=1 Tax=Caldivirga maquilingensis (strain ATCC 700844 / DSM 13496 / JCM 10307 / IC-167) TaxID=397948 RepID=A8M979_CALMQ|nr:SDR family oxidoreductase [Caldivirga maquilingensis]ABW02298.1 NAD-dependent epimerase/dehydratase [Caldivirga maquilingensis IC-167]
MKVLVTGCGGYIGTTLVPYLMRKGYSIRCVDWLIFGEDVLSHVIGEKGFELVKADAREAGSEVLNGVDAVVDLAAIPNDPTGDLVPQLTWQINYEARVRMAKMAKEKGVARYILASSASVYGRQSGTVDETATPNPLTVYAKANLQAEREVLPLNGNGFTSTALRFSTVYGPSRRMRLDLVVNAMTLSAFNEGKIWVEGDGMQERPLVHVVDVARAVAFILETPPEEIGGQVFNVGSDDQNYKIIEIAKEVQQVTGAEIKFRGEVDRRSYRLSFAKIRKLGFNTVYQVRDGVRQVYHELLIGYLKPEDRWFTVKWYKKVLGL